MKDLSYHKGFKNKRNFDFHYLNRARYKLDIYTNVDRQVKWLHNSFQRVRLHTPYPHAPLNPPHPYDPLYYL